MNRGKSYLERLDIGSMETDVMAQGAKSYTGYIVGFIFLFLGFLIGSVTPIGEQFRKKLTK